MRKLSDRAYSDVVGSLVGAIFIGALWGLWRHFWEHMAISLGVWLLIAVPIVRADYASKPNDATKHDASS